MFSSGILDVAIGMAFVYLLLSLVCTAISEWIASLFKLRATNLEKGIRSLFSDEKFNAAGGGKAIADAIYDHGLVMSMYRIDKDGSKKLPSYIPSRTFALALLDILAPSDASGAKEVKEILEAVQDKLPKGPAQQTLFTIISQAKDNVDNARKAIEDWYDSGMDRVSGWYKRKTQIILLVLGGIVAFGTNTDSVLVAKTLWSSPTLRDATSKAAEQFVQKHKDGVKPNGNPPTTSGTPPAGSAGTGSADVDTPVTPGEAAKNVRAFNNELRELGLPIGWPTIQVKADGSPVPTDPDAPPDPRSLPKNWCSRLFWGRILGWFLTALAISFGAPFWFDTLNKFMVVRSTVKPKEKSQDEASKDAKPADNKS